MSVAELGFAVNSGPVKDATAALNDLKAAAGPAEKAAASLGTATTKAGHAHAGMSTQAAAAAHAIRSMGEQLALGVPPTQILTQQLAHLSFAASGPGGLKQAFSDAASTFGKLITPTTLVVGGLAGLAVGAYLAASSIKATELELANLSERIGTTVQALHGFDASAAIKGISTDDLVKGMTKFGDLSVDAQHNVGSLAELFRANGVAVGSLDDNLLRAADLIKNAATEADKYRLMQQLGLPATREWVQYLSQGSAGIKAAADEAAKFGDSADADLIAKAREADEKWHEFWKNFGDNAKSAFIVAEEGISDLLERASKQIGYAFHDIGLASSSDIFKATAAAGGGIKFGPGTDFSKFTSLNGMAAPATGTGGGKKTVNDVDVKKSISDDQQRIGLLGQMASVNDQVRQTQNALNLAGLAGVGVTKAQRDALLDLARENALGVTQMKAQVDANNVQAATIDMTVGKAAAFTAEMNRLNEATRNHQVLTQADKGAIHAQALELGKSADAAARAAVNSDIKFGQNTAFLSQSDVAIAQKLKPLFGDDVPAALASSQAAAMRLNDAFSTVSSSIENDMVSGLSDIANGSKTVSQGFSEMATSIINDIEKMIIKLEIVDPLMRALQGGIGGFLPGVGGGASPAAAGQVANLDFHNIGGVIPSAKGNIFSGAGLSAFSNSVVDRPTYFKFASGAGLMGEAGPEAIMPLTRGSNGKLGVAASNDNGGGTEVHIHNAPAGTTATAKTTKTPGGGTRTDIVLQRMVEDAVIGSMRPNGRVGQHMERTYNVNPMNGRG